MLINNSAKYDAGDIICFKMVNGDEIVAKIVESHMSGWTVSRPCTVMPSPQGIGLIQSLFTAEINKNVDIRADHVMLHAPVIKQMEDHYFQTTTGIKTVSAL